MNILFIADFDTFQEKTLEITRTAANYADRIWFRIRHKSKEYIREHAQYVRDTVKNIPLLISSDPEMAVTLGYDGVHLSCRDYSPGEIKKRYPGLITGYSSHSVTELPAEADYYTLSPIFPTSKPYPVYPLGPVEAPAPNTYALGGINLENISGLREKGYTGVAGISFYKELPEIASLLKTWR